MQHGKPQIHGSGLELTLGVVGKRRGGIVPQAAWSLLTGITKISESLGVGNERAMIWNPKFQVQHFNFKIIESFPKPCVLGANPLPQRAGRAV